MGLFQLSQAPVFLTEPTIPIHCGCCRRHIESQRIVRPRFDYILCPHCGVEFVPQVFVL